MTSDFSGHFGPFTSVSHVVMAPVRWPQPTAMHSPSCLSRRSWCPSSFMITPDLSVNYHYSNVVFYTIMSFDQNITICQKIKSPFHQTQKREFQTLVTLVQLGFPFLCPEGPWLLMSVLAQSQQVFLIPKGTFVFIFFSRGQCHKRNSGWNLWGGIALPVLIARPYGAAILSICTLTAFQPTSSLSHGILKVSFATSRSVLVLEDLASFCTAGCSVSSHVFQVCLQYAAPCCHSILFLVCL